MYLLDTNICIFIKNRKPLYKVELLENHAHLLAKLIYGSAIFIGNICPAEMNASRTRLNKSVYAADQGGFACS